MKRLRMVVRAVLISITIASVALPAHAAVKPVSTDGEATVYLTEDFSADFDVAYRAVLTPDSHNKTWSTLSILLIGRQIPGPGASVGLVSDPAHPREVRVFTDVVYPNLPGDRYKRTAVGCRTSCVIELRGDAARITAYVNGKEVSSWSRSDLYLQRPYIQLNAEVHGPGDAIAASLTRTRAIVAGRAIQDPKCAFTTRGIEPSGRDVLRFRGVNTTNGGAFVNLVTGAHGDRC